MGARVVGGRAAEFIDFAIERGALRFGSFALKSGRVSPYFFDAGLFRDGESLARLGRFYAGAARENVDPPFMLFGPAYKGITLAAATAMALGAVDFAYDRKEVKDHGEGGRLVGAPLEGRVVIVDDVITSGLSIDHSVALIRGAGAVPAAVLISLDRRERTLHGERSAVDEVARRHGIPVHAVATLDDLVARLRQRGGVDPEVDAVEAYRDRYGARPS